MECKKCGKINEEGMLFCGQCGAPLNSEEVKTEESDNAVSCQEVKAEAKPKKLSDKTIKIIDISCFSCWIAGIVGIVLFLGIVIVGVASYGRVYLFDGYEFTKALTVISIVLMMIGFCSVIAKCVLYFIFKIGRFPTKLVLRILYIGVAVLSFALSIWGFVDASKTNSDNSSSSSGSGSGNIAVNFAYAYVICGCSSPWAYYGSDYLSVDTNPYDYDSDLSGSTTYASVALTAIRNLNSEFGLPSYVYQDMLETRALDGKQTYTGTKVTVSWRYHPDAGLEVRYVKS
ncbi:MAG: zinc-ribbon domain-containing protein [Candidatus Coproplasma sp.]